ncbi:MAG: hypothetical protein ACRDTM_00285 [Micromonosporaceae bacterium]
MLHRGFRWSALTATFALVLVTAGCGGSKPLNVTPSASTPAPPETPAEQLLGRVAAAKDARYAAAYTLRTKGRPDRTVTVTLAADGGWSFAVPGGAHGGRRDVTLAGTDQGVFQCTGKGCVKIAGAGKPVPRAYDVRVQRPFVDWLDVLADTRAALSVAGDTTFSVPIGDCFSVEPNAAALAPPMDAGIYCFDTDGVLTGAQFGGRSLVISAAAGKPPKTLKLPAPVIAGKALSTAPPPPKPTPIASPSPSKSR